MPGQTSKLDKRTVGLDLLYYSKVPNKRRDGIVVDSGKFYKI